MKKYIKDVAAFSVGSMVAGASATAVAPFGSTYVQGISTAASMMPAVGSVVGMGAMTRTAMKMLPNRKKKRGFF